MHSPVFLVLLHLVSKGDDKIKEDVPRLGDVYNALVKSTKNEERRRLYSSRSAVIKLGDYCR